MKAKLSFFFLFFVFTLNCFAQKAIVITGTPKNVPPGKKWVLATAQDILVELSESSLNSGSRCNADLGSTPRILGSIVEGDYGHPKEVYGILFKELNKVHYANSLTYSIVPVALVDSKFILSELSMKPLDLVGQRLITFYPGQKIYTSDCLKSIQVLEYTLTLSDSSESIKIENEEKKDAIQRDREGKRHLDEWKAQMVKKSIEDSLENVRMNTYPRTLMTGLPYYIELLVEKMKNGRVDYHVIGHGCSAQEWSDEFIPKIKEIVSDRDKGKYDLTLKIIPSSVFITKEQLIEVKRIDSFNIKPFAPLPPINYGPAYIPKDKQ
jgi:hypothetical protein